MYFVFGLDVPSHQRLLLCRSHKACSTDVGVYVTPQVNPSLFSTLSPTVPRSTLPRDAIRPGQHGSCRPVKRLSLLPPSAQPPKDVLHPLRRGRGAESTYDLNARDMHE